MKTVDVRAWRKGKRIGIKVTIDGSTSELRYLKLKTAQKLIDKLRAGAKAKKYTLTERPRFVPTRISDALVFRGDSFVVMQQLEDCSVDTVICDPPYHLTATKKDGSRGKTGFMGKTWDGGDIAFRPAFWAEALRVTKPGGYLLAFSGSRTFHRMAVAIEDAGWQIKDTCVAYAYGSGFPKSKNISADIDKMMGKKPTVVGQEETSFGYQEDRTRKHTTRDITKATSEEAKKWEGYGSALKPSYEPIVVAMKALDGTYAQNALKHGVAGFNIDGARIKTGEALQSGGGKLWSAYISGTPGKESTGVNTKGRWPANLLFSHTPFCVCTGTRKVKSGDGKADYTPTGKQGAVAVTRNVKTGAHYGVEEVKTWNCHPSCLVAALDRQGEAMGVHGAGAEKPAEYSKGKVKGESRGGVGVFRGVGGSSRVGDNGGISRFYQTFEPEVPFFYTAKCSGKERTAWGKVKNMHPTLKPLSICRYLCKLTRTPTGGVVLDPFMGSGSMGIAALLEGRQYIGIELERASFKTAVARIKETPTYAAVAKREAKEREIKLDNVMKWTRMPKLFND